VIVVDVNIIVYLLTETPQRELARGVRECDRQWVVPPLWRHEMLNVLATLARQDVLDAASALTVWRNALGVVGTGERPPDMERALSLAVEHGASAYDAQYVALAESLGVSFVTEDKKVQRLFPDRAYSMADFLTARSPEQEE
jgi:predicted nucleic acid-binding protein